MQTVCEKLNGMDTDALRHMIADVTRDAAQGDVSFQVCSRWRGGTRSETTVETCELAGQRIHRGFRFEIDEPRELLGAGEAANPQEVLLAAVNACMIVGFVATCAMRGIRLQSLEFHTHGRLDLRGFLGLDASIPPGYDEILCTIRVAGDAAPEQFREVLDTVLATSPNYYNMTRCVRLMPRLEVETGD